MPWMALVTFQPACHSEILCRELPNSPPQLSSSPSPAESTRFKPPPSAPLFKFDSSVSCGFRPNLAKCSCSSGWPLRHESGMADRTVVQAASSVAPIGGTAIFNRLKNCEAIFFFFLFFTLDDVYPHPPTPPLPPTLDSLLTIRLSLSLSLSQCSSLLCENGSMQHTHHSYFIIIMILFCYFPLLDVPVEKLNWKSQLVRRSSTRWNNAQYNDGIVGTRRQLERWTSKCDWQQQRGIESERERERERKLLERESWDCVREGRSAI